MASDMGVINACEWDAFLPASVRGSMESFTLLDDELSTGVEFVNFRLFEEPCETDWVLSSEQTSMEQHRFQASFAKLEVPVPPPCSVGMGPMVQFDSPIRPPLARSQLQLGVNLSRTVDVPPAPQSLGLHAFEPGHSGWGRTLQARADVPCFNSQQQFALPARLQVADDGRQQLCSSMEDCNAAFKIQMHNRVDTCSPPADAAAWPSNSSSSVVTITRGTCVTTEMTKPAGAGPVSGSSTTSSPSTMDIISTGHIHALRQCVDRVASVSGPLSALSEIEHAANDQLMEAPCPSPTLSKAATSSNVAAAPTGANKKRSRQDVAASMAVTAGPVKKSSKRMSCWNCGAHSTPQWRCGPDGPRTLCNACGVRYKKGLPLAYLSAREAEANKQAPSPMSEESAAATP